MRRGNCAIQARAAAPSSRSAWANQAAASRCEALLAITHHHVDAGRAHEIDGRSRVGPVGDHVAGTDGARRRNPEPRGFVEQRTRRFEIAVGPAKYDRGAVAMQLVGFAHARRPPTRLNIWLRAEGEAAGRQLASALTRT
jgi:hypothetical protein